MAETSQAIGLRGLRPEQKSRIAAWLLRFLLFYVVAAVYMTLTRIFGIKVDLTYFVFGIAAFVAALLVGSALQFARDVRASIADIDKIDHSLGWRDLYRRHEDSLLAAFVADAIVSYAALIVLSASIELSDGHVYQSIAFVLYLAVLIVVLQLSVHGYIKIKGWLFYALFICALPALLNYPIIQLPFETASVGAGLRTFSSGILLLLLVILSGAAMSIFAGTSVYSWLLNLVPSRRGIARSTLPISNRMAVIEYFFFAELFMIGAASVAIGGSLYTFYQLSGMQLVFAVFNLLISVPAVCALLVAFSRFDAETAFLVRRVGTRYAVVTMAIANVFLALGYLLGYVVRIGYETVFGELGRFPIPDMAYAAFAISPAALPFAAQIEGLIAASLTVLALSWLAVVVQQRALGEFVWIVGGMVLVVALPKFKAELDSLTSAISPYFPLFRQAPEAVVAVSIPAIKSLFTSEVEIVVKDRLNPPQGRKN